MTAIRTKGNTTARYTSLQGVDFVKFRPFDAVVINYGAAAIRLCGRDVNSMRTYFEACTFLQWREYLLFNLGSIGRLEWAGVVKLRVARLCRSRRMLTRLLWLLRSWLPLLLALFRSFLDRVPDAFFLLCLGICSENGYADDRQNKG